jgi:hypothetical protein
MSIIITPIPKLTNFGTPGFTLGTANSAGDSNIAVANNSTLLTYDTTLPAAVSTASATGSAVTAARRDHVHSGALTSTIVNGTRTASAGGGDQAVTGAGFAPTTLLMMGQVNSNYAFSFGFGDDAGGEIVFQQYTASGDYSYSTARIAYLANSGNEMTALVKSLDADGCTLTWYKSSSGVDVVWTILFLR